MQYHALALAVNAGEVDLIGLEGAPVHQALTAEPRVHCHRLPDRGYRSRERRGRGWFLLLSAVRNLGLGLRLLSTLLRVPRPDLILVQTPPASPTLPVAWLAARLRGARLVVDWHNLAHTVLAVKTGTDHRAVKALRRSERRWARRADGHLAVSAALAEWLSREAGVTAVVLHDRPPAFFARPDPADAATLWTKLAAEHRLGPRRLPLVVCPTSWTPDEDFDLLLEALERTERRLAERLGPGDASAPSMAVILTGRGPMRPAFEARVARRPFVHVAVRTAWLEPAAYPVLVGSADLGLCLHRSSSGLDLPMKLADFRGAGVAVATFDYAPVLAEVLTPGHEGVTFNDPAGLTAILTGLAAGDFVGIPRLAAARQWLVANPPRRWEEEWRERQSQILGLKIDCRFGD
ncbi:MAG: glycosyltransferase [Vicinamibacterales bacterium]